MSETLNITLEDVEYLVEFEFYPAEENQLYDFWEIIHFCQVKDFDYIPELFWKPLEEKYSKQIHEAILQRVKELKEDWDL